MQSKLLLVISISLLAVACNPVKKIEKKNAQAVERLRNRPDLAADLCAELFPVKEEVDSSAYKESIADNKAYKDSIDKQYKAFEEQLIEEATRQIYEAEQKGLLNPDCDSISNNYKLAISKLQSAVKNANERADAAARSVEDPAPVTIKQKDTAEEQRLKNRIDSLNSSVSTLVRTNNTLQTFKDSMKGKVHIPWWILLVLGVSAAAFLYVKLK